VLDLPIAIALFNIISSNALLLLFIHFMCIASYVYLCFYLSNKARGGVVYGQYTTAKDCS
jgi:hypothetical protein